MIQDSPRGLGHGHYHHQFHADLFYWVSEDCWVSWTPTLILSWVWPLPRMPVTTELWTIFSRESQPKPLFATGILGRGHTQILSSPFLFRDHHNSTLQQLDLSHTSSTVMGFYQQNSSLKQLISANFIDPNESWQIYVLVCFGLDAHVMLTPPQQENDFPLNTNIIRPWILRYFPFWNGPGRC